MDEDHVLEIEEGEISDDSEHNYVPLERPPNYSALQNQSRFPPQKDTESEDEPSSESESDSDSNTVRTKKPRIKVKPKLRTNPKLKKYDVWSSRAQEDVLTETLISCDVTTKDRSRAVESYDYTLGAKYYKNCDDSNTTERKNNKRSLGDRNNKNIRHHRRRSSSSEGKLKKGSKRIILPISAQTDCTDEDLAKDIANKLCEHKEELILKVITVFGRERVLEVFEETRKIEADGGLMIMNQTRRRTPGGVFLYLVRTHYHITPEQRNKIFGEDKYKEKAKHKRKQKAKMEKFKKSLAAAKTDLLPDLLTRAEMLISESNRSRDETDIKDVINPPPTPETDCHENSNDGMESLNPVQVCEQIEKMEVRQRKLETYDDDFLDIGCSDNMDLF